MFKGLNIIEFSERFATDDDCRKYLSEIKWKNGYQCGKCGHTRYYEIKKVGSRQCIHCKYAESATARTLFHKVKFPLRKAFYIAFMVVTNKKGVSSYELSRKLGLRQKTCWSFKQKVIEAMKSGGNNPLKGDIEVDEFYVGGPEAGNTGRGNETKQQVVMAIQTDSFGIHRCYAKVIPSAHSAELQVFFDKHIAQDANIRTDGWKGYASLKERYPGIQQENSAKGKAFPLIHRQIMMFKAWLRGTHHHCAHLQKYIDEFCYRFNRLKHQDTLFHRLIERMVFVQPLFYQKYQCY
ncbi:MAG TPA: IS1595 family transposase [Mucilaginibacter sp.]|jgi:hypothetical protein